MPLEDIESAGKYITDLVVTNPESTDYPGQDGDNHLRGIKNVLKNSLPNITGPVTATQAELNLLDGKTTVATLEGNTFTGEQIITYAGARSTLNSTSLNSQYWFQDNGNNRGVVYWSRTGDSMNIRMYDADNVTARAELSLTETGDIDAILGTLKYGGVEVAVDKFYGSIAKVSAIKSGINGNINPLTSANSNIADLNDPNGWFNPTNGRFTPLVAGYYQANFSAQALISTGGFKVYIRKNGSAFTQDQDTDVDPYASCSGAMYMNGSTDYFDLLITSSDTSWSLQTTTHASFYRVGG